jgi:hypothetical protein
MIHTDEDDEFERIAHEIEMKKGQPYVYTPKREWVGLTKEERDGKRVLENGLLFNSAEVQVWEIAVEWAEQKLKEKNT